MVDSILTDTKKMLGLAEDYTAFDTDITVHLNSTISILGQLGIAAPDDFVVEDADAVWDDLGFSTKLLGMVKTWIYLKIRLLFDPPSSKFHLTAFQQQIAEHEWRLHALREEAQPIPVVEPVRPVPVPPPNIDEETWWWLLQP